MCCTAGWGNTFPNECWSSAWLVMVQSIFGMILDAITIGIVFSRISHPKQRGRTIAISDSAIIARRDGILKFMFRVADIRRTQVSCRSRDRQHSTDLAPMICFVSSQPGCNVHSCVNNPVLKCAHVTLPSCLQAVLLEVYTLLPASPCPLRTQSCLPRRAKLRCFYCI